MNLEIVHENADEILAFCCFHNDTGRPNMLLNKSGEFAGKYVCWSCGARGNIADLGLEVDVKKTRRKKKQSPREMHGIWAELPYADEWIVPTEHLRAYGVKWNKEEQCWVCPMLNPKSQICGLQRRFKNGRKICVSGSKLGVFTTSAPWQEKLVICEGYSDTDAAATLGFWSIGRPCAAVYKPVVDWIWAHGANNNRIVIISDGNEVERAAAVELSDRIRLGHRHVRVEYPTHKDLSEDIAAGLGDQWIERIQNGTRI